MNMESITLTGNIFAKTTKRVKCANPYSAPAPTKQEQKQAFKELMGKPKIEQKVDMNRLYDLPGFKEAKEKYGEPALIGGDLQSVDRSLIPRSNTPPEIIIIGDLPKPNHAAAKENIDVKDVLNIVAENYHATPGNTAHIPESIIIDEAHMMRDTNNPGKWIKEEPQQSGR
jgi:hypothetical protein